MSVVIRASSATKSSHAALSLLKDLPQLRPQLVIDTVCYNSALAVCAEVGDTNAAFALLDEMEKSRLINVLPNEKTYTSLISALLSQRSPHAALDVMRRMRENRIRWDTQALSMCMAALTDCGYHEETLQLLALIDRGVSWRIQRLRQSVDGKTRETRSKTIESDKMGLESIEVKQSKRLPSLLTAQATNSAERTISPLLRDLLGLHQDGSTQINAVHLPLADTKSFNIAINACRRSGKINLALELYDELQKRSQFHSAKLLQHSQKSKYRLSANQETYYFALLVCEATKNWSKALKIFEELRTRYITPSAENYEALVKVLISCKQYGRANEIILGMETKALNKINPRIYVDLIEGMIDAGSARQSIELVKAIAKKGVVLAKVVQNSYLHACERENAWQESIEALESMKAHAKSTVRYTINTKDLKPAPEQLNLAQPSLSQLLISKMQGEGDLFTQENQTKQPKQRSFPTQKLPDSKSYTFAIGACERAQQWDKALELVEEMIENKLPLTLTTYAYAISASKKLSLIESQAESRLDQVQKRRSAKYMMNLLIRQVELFSQSSPSN